ncbi:MAG TPA: hypothetical protein VLE91_03595 [Candidatus Saccharimonadales bacterium]|nr:hypothetical protein [Candidatus Saccharimonadales bacterium]
MDFVYVEKPQNTQMAAVLTSRLLGRKFIWIQGFSNPPIPNLVEKFLLTQADKLIVSDIKNANKLKRLGISRSKIQLIKS